MVKGPLSSPTSPITNLQIAPSIIAANLGHLADEAKRIEDAGADSIHIDIMDGHFVPNLTLGPQAVAAINRATDLFLDIHLMIYNPFNYIERFIESGANGITFHFEATEDVEDTLSYIRRCNVKAGLAFSPDTSASMILRYLDKCDMVLLMTVHPGFSGQPFLSEVLEKVKFTRQVCQQLQIQTGGTSPIVQTKQNPAALSTPPLDIQVDGGVNYQNVRQCVEAGANVIVSATTLFKEQDLSKAILEMRKKGLGQS